MNFGEKLQEARKQAGLSQEQFASKISVSRSAVAKWENNKGMPDIDNLKAISQLLDSSIDYLLDDEGHLDFNTLKEPIDIDSYTKTGKCRDKFEAVVLDKYKDAMQITPLLREKVLSKTEKFLEWTVMPTFGLFTIADQINHFGGYYLVEYPHKQYLVNVTKEFITSSEIIKPIEGKTFIIGQNKYKKANYQLI